MNPICNRIVFAVNLAVRLIVMLAILTAINRGNCNAQETETPSVDEFSADGSSVDGSSVDELQLKDLISPDSGTTRERSSTDIESLLDELEAEDRASEKNSADRDDASEGSQEGDGKESDRNEADSNEDSDDDSDDDSTKAKKTQSRMSLAALMRLKRPASSLTVSRPNLEGEAKEPENAAADYSANMPALLIGPAIGDWRDPDSFVAMTSSIVGRRPAFCHRPLYFEQSNLERCGNGCGCATNAFSFAKFFADTMALPLRVARTH